MAFGVLCLGVWIFFVFVAPAGLGVVHLLLATGVLLLIRGWVAVDSRRESMTRDV